MQLIPLGVGLAGFLPGLLVAVVSWPLGATHREDHRQVVVMSLDLDTRRPDLVLAGDVVEDTAVALLLGIAEFEGQLVVGVALLGADVPVGGAVAFDHVAIDLPALGVADGDEEIFFQAFQGDETLLLGGGALGGLQADSDQERGEEGQGEDALDHGESPWV